jgi:hypothetical protein
VNQELTHGVNEACLGKYNALIVTKMVAGIPLYTHLELEAALRQQEQQHQKQLTIKEQQKARKEEKAEEMRRKAEKKSQQRGGGAPKQPKIHPHGPQQAQRIPENPLEKNSSLPTS